MKKYHIAISSIINRHEKFYNEIISGKNIIKDYLENNNISILEGFIQNVKIVYEFYKKVYCTDKKNRIVFCGINPGRKGAGKTGVPFFDYMSLSNILASVKNNDSEQSAQFIWSVISECGIEDFFNNVYLTNICWLGFTKDKKNINYYEFDENIKELIFNEFLKEMRIIKPKIIFSLSNEVHNDLIRLKTKFNENWEINNNLKHPYFCSFNNTDEWRKKYLETIKSKTSA